jgi:hypothetical protein
MKLISFLFTVIILVYSSYAQDVLRIAVISDNHEKIAQTSRCIEDIMHNTGFPKIDILVNGGDWGLWNGQCQYEESVERGMLVICTFPISWYGGTMTRPLMKNTRKNPTSFH